MSSRPAKRMLPNSQFLDPTHYHLRALVLDYLCHSCYTKTAQAFARDSSIRHIDADGDEIMQPSKTPGDPSAGLEEEAMRLVHLRKEIRMHILSGRVDNAVTMLNEHFPSVLDENVKQDHDPRLGSPSPDPSQYIPSTSVDPAHLSLNLRILSFIESCRTVPLPYNPLGSKPHSVQDHPPNPSIPPHNIDDPGERDQYQAEQIAKGSKLYAVANMLSNPAERELYKKELRNVCGLLGYPIPEKSSMSLYMSQERREAVADQINSAVLYRLGLPTVSHLELSTRYTSNLWSFLHDFSVKPPPPGSWPPGVKLPPIASRTGNPPSTKSADDSVPRFDLRQFLDSKS